MDKEPKILLIDDNKDFLEIFGSKLENAGYKVVRALGGKEGVEKAKKTPPDLILLDLEMPEENGIEVLSRIHSGLGTKRFRIVFLTNYGEPQRELSDIDKKFAVEIGAAGYIRKSDNLDAIVDEVRNAFTR